MSAGNLDSCLAVTLGYEGGFVDNPADPGGATNMGITLRTLAAWESADLTPDDVRNMSYDTAAAIYGTNYWNTVRGDDLPTGVDLVVFDFGVNSGVAHAARALQSSVGAGVDGSVGPATLALVAASDPVRLINAVCDARMQFLRGLTTFATFGRGWTSRVSGVRAKATEMATSPASPTS